MKQLPLDKFDNFLKNADAETKTIYNDWFWYDAVVWYGDNPYHVYVTAVDPEAMGTVEKITENKYEELTAFDYMWQ